jgi:methyl-accepting chemotaxis protein
VEAFLATPRASAIYAAVVVAVFALVGLQAVARGEIAGEVIVRMSTQTMLFIGTGFIAFFLRRSFERNQSELERRLQDIDRVVGQARRVARGDLSGSVEGENEVSEVVRDMLDGLRKLVAQVKEGVQVLAVSANELDAMSTQQERSAVHQAAAVTETRQTVESLASASKRITDSTKSVLVNAESTLRTNEQTRERLSLLANHTRRIHELLELIQDIAHKSDILALNAALEGTRAGEAGRGFSLVAAQIQQLAERTMGALADVRALMEDITAATNGTVLSMEQATKLAADTARAAREIALTSQQQGNSVGEVVTTIGDIATITGELATATQETLAASRNLRSLSDRLHVVVTRFVL